MTPLLTVAKELQKKHKKLRIVYVGSGNALEQKLLQATDFDYRKISTGKLRRYFSLQNFTDFFKFLRGILQSYKIIKKEQPKLVFSKGGYVSLPVCIAAYLRKVPIIMHESDTVMGLANRLIAKTAKRICMTFDLKPKKDKFKYVLTGSPVRKEILQGKKKKALESLNFDKKKPVLLVMGGSQGAGFINDVIYNNLDEILETFQIIHICGRGKKKLIKKVGYVNFEYVQDELADYYALANLIISRGGASSMAEISALQKPNILIPLPSSANNHQYINAKYFEEKGASILLQQKEITKDKFLEILTNFWQNKEKQKEMQINLEKVYNPNALEEIVSVLNYDLND